MRPRLTASSTTSCRRSRETVTLDSSALRLRSSASRNAWTLLSERPADERVDRRLELPERELLDRELEARDVRLRVLDERDVLPPRLLVLLVRLRLPPPRPDLELPELAAMSAPPSRL
jgi:hypothetical protein